MMKMLYWILLIIMWLSVARSAAAVNCTSGQYEKCLYEALFDNGYNRNILPRKNGSQPITVYIKIKPYDLVAISEIDQTMTLNADWQSTWTDEYLTWNPTDYNGVDHITLKAHSVWLPDIALANSAGSLYNDDFIKLFQVVIQPNGSVFWEFAGLFSTLCPLDFLRYPFDKQTCNFLIENWSYTAQEVVLIADGTDTSQLSQNGLWDLMSLEENTSLDGSMRARIQINFSWKRKSKFYSINVILPSVYLTIMSLGVFWLPSECGEKGIFGITVLLCFTVYQIIVMGQTPPNSDATPLLTKYLSAMLAACATSVVSAMFVIYFNGTNLKKKVPTAIRILFFRYLARLLAIDVEGIRVESRTAVEPAKQSHSRSDAENVAKERKTDVALSEMTGSETAGVLKNLTRILEELTEISGRVEEKEKEALLALEWRMLAKVIERFIFACTFTGVIVIHIVLLVEMTQ